MGSFIMLDTQMFSPALQSAFDDALALASTYNHQYATLEHLLLALLDDPAVGDVINACDADPVLLRKELTVFIENELVAIKGDFSVEPDPTGGCLRVVERARLFALSSGREEISGPDVIAALFNERDSHAAYFMRRQNITRHDVVNFINYGIAKATDSHPDQGSRMA
jgi:ATP-dependent Clp protease ATP-binding subunit ClpA